MATHSLTDSTRRFSAKAELYHAYRPRYPEQCIAFLVDTFQLTPLSVIADIGSGTGISSQPFLRFGATVFGVEPNDEMRKVADRELSRYRSFHSIPATAEQTTLVSESLDLIITAQAFHWFDLQKVRREFSRIMKSSAPIVILWNERREKGSRFSKDLQALLGRYAHRSGYIRYHNVASKKPKGSSRIDSSILSSFFQNGIEGHRMYRHQQLLCRKDFYGRMLSYSYLPHSKDPNYTSFMFDLRGLFDAYQKERKVSIEYDTHVFWGR